MYRKIIFDLDGVITTEQAFWDAAALTAAEFLELPIMEPSRLRETLFYGDRLIKLVKNRGVNSNWDLVYLTYAFWETDGEKVYADIKGTPKRDFALYEAAGRRLSEKTGKPFDAVRRGSALWQEMADSFQEWFLGSDTFSRVYGKPPRGARPGLWNAEEPIVPQKTLLDTLCTLREMGAQLCIATARPLPEGREPLVRWGAFPFFSEENAITYDYIRAAQEKLGVSGLGKPHPYIFLKAYFGKDFPDERLVDGTYPKDFSDCLIVGDAGADLFAAKAMGADFAAVLTGVSGEDGRGFFSENGAKFILPDISALPRALQEREEKQK